MRDDTPSVYLLAGPSGPVKAAYVQALIEHGLRQVPVGPAAHTAAALIEHVRSGRDAFLDHDFTEAADRDQCKALVEEHGGQWCLISFAIDHGPLAAILRSTVDGRVREPDMQGNA